MKLGVVGLGYWGPSLARNFASIAGCELAWCCDPSAQARERWRPSFPAARFSGELDDLLADPALDAVVLATPVPTHYELSKRALEAGKHVLVEKPPAMKGAEMDELVSIAAERDLGVARDVGGDDEGVDRGVREHLAQVGRRPRRRKARAPAFARLVGDVADPAQLGAGQAVEVAREVRAPVAEPDDPDADRGGIRAHGAPLTGARGSPPRSRA